MGGRSRSGFFRLLDQLAHTEAEPGRVCLTCILPPSLSKCTLAGKAQALCSGQTRRWREKKGGAGIYVAPSLYGKVHSHFCLGARVGLWTHSLSRRAPTFISHASTAGWNESQRSDSLTCASPQESTERHTRKWLTSSSPRMAQNLSMVLQIPVDLTTLPLTVDLTEEEVIRLRSVWTSVRSSF